VAIRREMDALLQRALERMTPNDRQIVDLHYRAWLSRKEIAERLDLPIEAIHARCDRTRSRLRKALSRHVITVALGKLEPEGISFEDIQSLRPAFRRVGISRLRSACGILKCEPTADFSKAREENLAGKEA